MGHHTTSFLPTAAVFPANPCFSSRRITVDCRWSTATCLRRSRLFSSFIWVINDALMANEITYNVALSTKLVMTVELDVKSRCGSALGFKTLNLMITTGVRFVARSGGWKVPYHCQKSKSIVESLVRAESWVTCMRKDMETLVSCTDYEEKGASSRFELKGRLEDLVKVEVAWRFYAIREGCIAMIIHSLSISSFIFLRWSHLNLVSMLLKMRNCLHVFSTQAFSSTSWPFASLSNPLNKPTPLNLDVSLPSIGDLQWSLARMIYLFNMQVERNVATFLLVLIVACFSFVVIGGLLFFKFRGDTQSLEDCFWEAWACLISSSTHLRV
ncbi:putative ion channel POLLUX-like 2 [Bienertia sinuspersici]